MTTAQTKAEASDVKRLAKLIDGIQVAMLTTVEDDGALRSRPMMTLDDTFDGTLWFFTREHSAKVEQVARDEHVSVSYAEPKDDRYVSVTGVARVVHDREKARALWSPVHKAWFPKGVEDPELALLRVDVTQAEYWDLPSSKMVQLVGFARALLTGKRADDLGTSHKVDFTQGSGSVH